MRNRRKHSAESFIERSRRIWSCVESKGSGWMELTLPWVATRARVQVIARVQKTLGSYPHCAHCLRSPTVPDWLPR